jgi:hypothetical protein
MRFFKIIVNWTPKIWLPLAIVLLNGVINFSWTLYFLVYLDLYGLDLLKGTHTKVFSGFFTIARALIDWILISVLLFFGCQLLYNGKGVFRNFFKSIGPRHLVGEGVFRNFFKIIGLCHLFLLVATLTHLIFISTSLPPDLTTLKYDNTTSSQERSEAITEAWASLELPVQLINIASHICFVLILVAVVQAFFEINWIQAFCITCISYAIYWILSEALWSIFSHVLVFFYLQFFPLPSWQPGDPIVP